VFAYGSRPATPICGAAFRGLALLFQETLKADPYSGHLFVFRGKRGDLIKIIWHGGQGARLFSKRLERGRFIWPKLENGAVTISPAQLAYMLEGIDWRASQKTYRSQVAG
jgi:transposase